MHERIDAVVGDLAEKHHGVFAAHHLQAVGIASHERKYRLRTGRWVLLYEGVYRVTGTPLTWRGSVLAACWAGGLRAAASGRTAAELWEFPGRSDAVIELTCPRWRRARHDGLRVHESLAFDEIDITSRDGIPVTTPARTLFDLAGLRGRGTLDLAVDNALRRRLTTVSELVATGDRLARSGRKGSGLFRAVLDVRNGAVTESEAERRLLQILEHHGLPRPDVQYEIRDDAGRLIARVDFAYPGLKIAIEYDSYEHHVGKEALDRDGARRNSIVALGWLPITATAADLRNQGQRLAADVRRARALRSGVNADE